MAIHIPEEAFKNGVLHRQVHRPLLDDLEHTLELAGIPPEFIWRSARDFCSEDEIDWLTHINHPSDYGLAILHHSGKTHKPVIDRMMAMASALTRNFKESKVTTVQVLLESLKDGSYEDPRVLLVPNFCMPSTETGKVADWHIPALLDVLYRRMSKNLKTVIYIGSMDNLEKLYGTAFREHVQAHFSLI